MTWWIDVEAEKVYVYREDLEEVEEWSDFEQALSGEMILLQFALTFAFCGHENMQEIHQSVLEQAEILVSKMLSVELPEGMLFHDLAHTRRVVEMAEAIARYEQFSPADTKLLLLAAWFHDLGYTRQYRDHESASQDLLRNFLQNQSVSTELSDQACALIDATRLNWAPQNPLEEALKDADLASLAEPRAIKKSDKLRAEWLHFLGRDMSDEQWLTENYEFFSSHSFYTHYGQTILAEGLQENARRLKKKLKKEQKKQQEDSLSRIPLVQMESIDPAAPSPDGNREWEGELREQDKELKKLKKRLKSIQNQRPDRGIETMFRTTLRNQLNLSSIADNKANILISINAILISIIFSLLVQQLDNYPYMVVPTIILLSVSLITIILSILATRPKVTSGTFTREDILNKRTNLLFFGNFYRMEIDDYLWGMKEMMQDSDYLYGSMTKDIYFHGKVLAKKFQLLRWAYTVFMFGMSIAVIAFGIAILW